MTAKKKFEINLVKNICNIWFNWKIWKSYQGVISNLGYEEEEEEDVRILDSIIRAVGEKWILGLMKLLDDTHKDDNKKTLSLKEYKNSYLGEEGKKLVEDFFKSNCNEKKKIIELRNNYFCHSDKEYHLKGLDSLFEENNLKYEELENILMQIIDLLKKTSSKFNQNGVDTNEMDSCLNVTESSFNQSWLIFENKIKKDS